MTRPVRTDKRRQARDHSNGRRPETAVPFTAFKDAGYSITFATEQGSVPKCDSKMLEGITQLILVSILLIVLLCVVRCIADDVPTGCQKGSG